MSLGGADTAGAGGSGVGFDGVEVALPFAKAAVAIDRVQDDDGTIFGGALSSTACHLSFTSSFTESPVLCERILEL